MINEKKFEDPFFFNENNNIYKKMINENEKMK